MHTRMLFNEVHLKGPKHLLWEILTLKLSVASLHRDVLPLNMGNSVDIKFEFPVLTWVAVIGK